MPGWTDCGQRLDPVHQSGGRRPHEGGVGVHGPHRRCRRAGAPRPTSSPAERHRVRPEAEPHGCHRRSRSAAAVRDVVPAHRVPIWSPTSQHRPAPGAVDHVGHPVTRRRRAGRSTPARPTRRRRPIAATAPATAREPAYWRSATELGPAARRRSVARRYRPDGLQHLVKRSAGSRVSTSARQPRWARATSDAQVLSTAQTPHEILGHHQVGVELAEGAFVEGVEVLAGRQSGSHLGSRSGPGSARREAPCVDTIVRRRASSG